MARQKFRETLWFKKGKLDAEQAQQAQQARQAPVEDDLALDAADLLPVEDRYLDDGSVTRSDTDEFGVHTGSTQHVRTLLGDLEAAPSADGAELRTLVREMKRRRGVFAAIGASVALGAALAILQVF